MNNLKNELTGKRWGAATGYLAFALGIAAAGFERGAPPANAPVEQSLAYFVKYRTELLAQSLLFVLSAGVLLWFIGTLRSFLFKAEEGTGRLSSVAFGAGILWAGLQLVLQSAQVALAMGANAELPAALAGMMGDLTYALSVIAYVPMGIMLIAALLVGGLGEMLRLEVGIVGELSDVKNSEFDLQLRPMLVIDPPKFELKKMAPIRMRAVAGVTTLMISRPVNLVVIHVFMKDHICTDIQVGL